MSEQAKKPRSCIFCGAKMDGAYRAKTITDETGKWTATYYEYYCPDCKMRMWL